MEPTRTDQEFLAQIRTWFDAHRDDAAPPPVWRDYVAWLVQTLQRELRQRDQAR